MLVGFFSVWYRDVYRFSKHLGDESSFGIRRPQPALCRWNRGLETRTWPSRLFVPAGFMPAERRFDDYGDGGSTFNASCQTRSPLARGQWGCDNKLRVHLVPKPSDHWHRASGADGLLSRQDAATAIRHDVGPRNYDLQSIGLRRTAKP